MPETIHLQLLLATFVGSIGGEQAVVIAYKCVIEIRKRLGGLLKYYYRSAV